MNSLIHSQQKLFGLLELDATGTVLYSKLEGDGNSDGLTAKATGLNFFSEVAPFINVAEFHQRLEAFNRSSEQAHSFVFHCNYEDGAVPVRVLLARIREHSSGYRTESLLIHLKRAG